MADLLDFINQALKDGTATETRVNAAALGGGTPAKLPADPGESEAAFQQRVIDLAHANGWLVAHFRAVRIARADGSFYHATPVQADGEGFPDLLLLRGPSMVVAELKVGKNTASDRQVVWLDAFRQLGSPSGVWRPADWPKIVETLSAPWPDHDPGEK